MWKTVGYRIESAMIEQAPRAYREVWFLDAVQEHTNGTRGTKNVCNGSKQYCQDTLSAIRNGEA